MEGGWWEKGADFLCTVHNIHGPSDFNTTTNQVETQPKERKKRCNAGKPLSRWMQAAESQHAMQENVTLHRAGIESGTGTGTGSTRQLGRL
jgi:hypothetical protein